MTISAAPALRAASRVSMPMGPAPVISTFRPRSAPARFTACRHTASGSPNAAFSSARLAGTFTHCRSSATSRWRKPPCTCGKHRAAVEQHVEAMPREALEAVAAGVAWAARIDRDLVARPHPIDERADGGNGAGDLVAENHRLLDPDRAEAAVLVIVQIRAADAADGDAHLDVLRPERRHLGRFEPQVAGRMDDDGERHDGLPCAGLKAHRAAPQPALLRAYLPCHPGSRHRVRPSAGPT